MEVEEKKYKRQRNAPQTEGADNLSAVTRVLLESAKVGHPCSFSDNEKGLAEFQAKTVEYLRYVQNINDTLNKKVIPDIEGWACYIGVTSRTIANYEKDRSAEWTDYIQRIKNGIASIKKEASFHGQIQPMIAVFDLANNHGYKNTSEFRLEVEAKQVSKKALSDEEIQAMLNVEGVPQIDKNSEIVDVPFLIEASGEIELGDTDVLPFNGC